MYLGIEMGGTKVVLAVGTGPGDLSEAVRVATRDPATTCADVITVARQLAETHGPFEAVGVGTFGPIGLSGPDFGIMRRTPKAGWTHFPLIATLQEGLPDVRFALDTDVNAAALAEARWGGARGLEDFAYVTVGTGIGVGLVSGGKTVHGLLHPEAGHIRVQHDHAADPYAGSCPFHGDCLEGLASGPTVEGRLGIKGEHVPDDWPVWPLLGSYLAQLYCNLTLVASPKRILVGGGVGLKAEVLAASRDTLHTLLGGYVEALSDRVALDTYVVAAELGDRAGVLGAIAIALNA